MFDCEVTRACTYVPELLQDWFHTGASFNVEVSLSTISAMLSAVGFLITGSLRNRTGMGC